MGKRFWLSAVCAALLSCSAGVVSVGGNDFYCHNLGRTKCKFSVTQYQDGMPIEAVEIEVKGGSISETFSELIRKVALVFSGASL